MGETNHLKLDPAFADVLTNLYIATQIGSNSREVKLDAYLRDHPDDRDVLVNNLTRSLADIAYRIEHERHLHVMRVSEVCDDVFFNAEERQERLLRGGPGMLQNAELGHAALSLHLSLWWKKIGEGQMTRFWTDAIEAAMGQAAREKGEHRQTIGQLVDDILEQDD